MQIRRFVQVLVLSSLLHASVAHAGIYMMESASDKLYWRYQGINAVVGGVILLPIGIGVSLLSLAGPQAIPIALGIGIPLAAGGVGLLIFDEFEDTLRKDLPFLSEAELVQIKDEIAAQGARALRESDLKKRHEGVEVKLDPVWVRDLLDERGNHNGSEVSFAVETLAF